MILDYGGTLVPEATAVGADNGETFLQLVCAAAGFLCYKVSAIFAAADGSTGTKISNDADGRGSDGEGS